MSSKTYNLVYYTRLLDRCELRTNKHAQLSTLCGDACCCWYNIILYFTCTPIPFSHIQFNTQIHISQGNLWHLHSIFIDILCSPKIKSKKKKKQRNNEKINNSVNHSHAIGMTTMTTFEMTKGTRERENQKNEIRCNIFEISSFLVITKWLRTFHSFGWARYKSMLGPRTAILRDPSTNPCFLIFRREQEKKRCKSV